MVVDQATGTVLSHRAPKKPLAGGKDFDSLFAEMDAGKAQAEAAFEREKAAMKDHDRLLEEKFQEALRRAKEEPDEELGPRDFELD
jgi:hypothetical protein